jgi:hypothetical protein
MDNIGGAGRGFYARLFLRSFERLLARNGWWSWHTFFLLRRFRKRLWIKADIFNLFKAFFFNFDLPAPVWSRLSPTDIYPSCASAPEPISGISPHDG